MSNIQVQLRRGTTAQHSTFTGAEGELTFNTSKKSLILHDGITAGGVNLARESYANVKDFGAVGDGVTDDTAAIQAAIDTQLPVFLPSGQYLHTGLTINYSKASITGQGAVSVLLYNGESAAISVDAGSTALSLGTFSDFQIELNGDTCIGIQYVSSSTNFRHSRLTFIRPLGNSTSNLVDFSIGVSYVNTTAFSGIHQFYGCRWERFATAVDVNPTGIEVTELLFESCVFNAVRRAIYDHQTTPVTMACTFRVDKCVVDASSNAENLFYTDVGGCQILNTRIETKTGWDACVPGSTTEACPFHFGTNSQQNVVANCAFIPLVTNSYLFEGIRNTFIHPQDAWRAHKRIDFDQNSSTVDAENKRIGLGTDTFSNNENLLIQDTQPIIRIQDPTNTHYLETKLYTAGGGAGNVEINLGNSADDRYTINTYSLRGNSDESSDIGEVSRRWNSVYAQTLRPGTGSVTWTTGSGSPEGVLTAVVGSLYLATNGGAGTTLFVKESGTGNTGWVAK